MTISRRTVISTPIALAAASLAPRPSQAQGSPIKDVTLCLSLEPSALDPTVAAAAGIGAVVQGNILEGLTKLSENGDVLPLLATHWTLSSGGRRYTFDLRKHVRFHDGSEFNSATVKYSIERAKASGRKNKLQNTLFNNIVSIFTPDVYTVVLELDHADPLTLFRLAESPAVIVHPDSAAQTAHHPVGTGPYVYDGRVAGESIRLKRWAASWHTHPIHIDSVTFRFIDDPTLQMQATLRGEVDLLFNIATQNVAAFQANNRYEVLIGNSSSKGMLALNNRRPPLDDVRVRRAIMHAIDREGFIRHALDGRGRAIGSHFAPSDPGYINLTGLYPYDPDQARLLMQQAAINEPLNLTLSLPPTPYALSGGPIIAAALADINIHITQQPISWTQWLEGPFSGDFDLTIINHVEPLDYHIYTRPDYYFGYDSAEFRELVQRHDISANPREQRMLFNQIQRHLAEDAVNAWLFTPQISTVVRKGLKGVWMNYPFFYHDIAAMYWE